MINFYKTYRPVMPRPQKYSALKIAEAIDSLVAEGKEVNPSRIRQRLGGGNIQRIKAIMDQRELQPAAMDEDISELPASMQAELRRHSDQNLRRTRLFAATLWQAACEEVSRHEQEQNALLRSRIAALEEELSKATDLKHQLERSVLRTRHEKEQVARDRSEPFEQCEQLKAALRNAESDLRASERAITVLERTQRRDREEIRSLQKRIEELVAELATINAKN